MKRNWYVNNVLYTHDMYSLFIQIRRKPYKTYTSFVNTCNCGVLHNNEILKSPISKKM